MQLKSKAVKTPLNNTNHNPQGLGENLHYILVADHHGIDNAFEAIKCKIRKEPNSYLTLIYVVQWLFPKPLYQFELELLERRFPSRLIVFYAFNCEMIAPGLSEVEQQLLEIIINANTSETMHFQIAGEEELVDAVSHRLHFLGINPSQINLQILK